MGQFLKRLILMCMLGAATASAQNIDKAVGSDTGLRIPRFVSLKSNEVNLRRGPGSDYRIDWVYVRENLPVMVTAEHNHWRRIRDSAGAEGWIHRALLRGRRTAEIIDAETFLLTTPKIDAKPIARIELGAILNIKTCQVNWCQLKSKNYKGWVKASLLFGVLPKEEF